ncbi:MAG: glutamine-hydrolyzing GMP synthase [Fibrobacterota bacterium]
MSKRKHKIAVLDFGGQYAHLIANRVRRLGVFSEIVSPDSDVTLLSDVSGFIFSGGPHSVYDASAPAFNPAILSLGKPVLGICYGHQLICHALGGKVTPGNIREFGRSELTLEKPSAVFAGLPPCQVVWMSHGDHAEVLPEGFIVTASTKDCSVAAVEHPQKKIFGFQFHPEVTHTPDGMAMLGNFLDVCGCDKSWNMKRYLEETLKQEIVEKTNGRNVFLLVSGGVDSVVAFTLLNQILGPERVQGLHIDNGLMRKNETAAVEVFMQEHGFRNLKTVDASETFLSRLNHVADPERKRKIIGDTFIDVQRVALAGLSLDPEKYLLGQGTIYPDTIESGGTKHAALIKTHHNRVPIIAQMIKEGKVIEPLSELYKDEVRALGRELGLSEELIGRHPFPGPGIGVRVLCSEGSAELVKPDDLKKAQDIAIRAGYRAVALPLRSVGVQGDFRTYAAPLAIDGPHDWDKAAHCSTEVTNQVRAINRVVLLLGVNGGGELRLNCAYLTRDRLDLLREADDIVTRFLREAGLYNDIWQMPVVLLPVGNEAGKESVVLRPVCSTEAMTADFFRIPFDVLKKPVNAILALPGISAVYYDLTNKPPGTIEWE